MAQKLNIDIVARDKSKQALKGVRGGLDRVKSSVFNLQNAFIGLGAGLAIRSLVNTGKQIENLQVQLKFLFGSAKEGAKAFDEMAKFASKVPFSLEEIQSGSGVLAVVSKDAKELANLMKITGNVAAVTGLDFKTTAEQIQRSMSAGISAADLFRDRGVKSMLGFKAGATVSIEETVAAFERVFGEGGQFDGATDELAKTFSGTLSMIGDKVFNFKRTLLDAGFFAQLKSQFSDLNKSLEKNSETLDNIAISIGTVLGVAVEKLANGFKLISKFSSELGTALKVIVSLKIGFMFVRWARALIPIVASLRAIVSLSGVGLPLVLASVAASVATYKILGNELDKIEQKMKNNIKQHKESKRIFHGGGADFMGVKEIEKAVVKYKFYEDAIIRNKGNVIKVQETFREMNKKELTILEEKMKNIGQTIKEGLNIGIKKTSDAIARSLVLGEKLSNTFKQMAQQFLVNIISHLIQLIARKSVELAIEKMITREKQKQAALSVGSNLMGLGSLGSFFGKASGGAVASGKPVVVGERGPELFVPNSSGQITQNARGTGGGSTTVNFNINTVDARGFDELLTQSRGTITQLINQAVNERGAKSII